MFFFTCSLKFKHFKIETSHYFNMRKYINYGNNFTSSCLLVLCCIFNAVPDLVWSQPEGKIRYTPKTCFREVIVSFMSTLHAVWRFLSDVREFWGNELFRWFPLTLHQWFHPQLETLLPCCPVNTYAPHFSCRTKINRLATSSLWHCVWLPCPFFKGFDHSTQKLHLI